MTIDEQIALARSYIGVPFLHLGRDANGIDCVGLASAAKGLPAASLPVYAPDPHGGTLERELDARYGAPVAQGTIAASELQAGDVVAMQYAGPIRHVGIVANHPTIKGELSLIHTDSMLGRVTEHILDTKWLRRIKRVYR